MNSIDNIEEIMKKNGIMTMVMCLLCMLLMTGIWGFSIPVYADGARIKVEDVIAAPGETIEIKVKIVENPGIAFLRIPIVYDKTYFESIDMEGVGLEGWTIKTAAVWAEADNSDYTGDILIVRCKIHDDAPEGTAVVKLGDIEAWTDADEAVSFEVEGGTVTIQKGDGLDRDKEDKKATEATEVAQNAELEGSTKDNNQISGGMVIGIIAFIIIVGAATVIMLRKRNSNNDH